MQLYITTYRLFNVSRETFFLKILILVWQSCRIFSMNSEILFGRMPECEFNNGKRKHNFQANV